VKIGVTFGPPCTSTRSSGSSNTGIGWVVLAGGGFEEGRPEPGRREHESATLEVRGTHYGTAAGGADVAATTAAVTVPFASSEDDRNLQTVSFSFLPVICTSCCLCFIQKKIFYMTQRLT